MAIYVPGPRFCLLSGKTVRIAVHCMQIEVCWWFPGLPFVILNTLCGAYATYGLANLRYEWHAILLYGVIIVLQSIIAIQLMIFCVYLTPNQVIYLLIILPFATSSSLFWILLGTGHPSVQGLH